MKVAKNLIAAVFISAGIALLGLAGAGARAEGLDVPAGDVVLTVRGKISVTNGEGTAQFDQALLKSLPQHEFATSTIWTDGVATYKGVLLYDLLKALGASGNTLSATALNDYQIDIPIADITQDAPLLAYLSNGEPMSVREKGPLWVIYPFDDVAAYRTEQTYARSIWQVDRLEIKD